jgi:hypothetical protein
MKTGNQRLSENQTKTNSSGWYLAQAGIGILHSNSSAPMR